MLASGMRHTGSSLWPLALLLLQTLSFQAVAAGIDTKEAELKQVRGRIESIRKAIHADAERRDALATQLKSADLAVQSARQQLAAVRTQRVAAETKLAELKVERTETQGRIDAERGSLQAELASAYMNGRQEQLKLLLNQQDPARLGRMMAYYGYLGRARADRIERITEQLEHLTLLNEHIEIEATRLRDLEKQNERNVQALSGARKQRAQTLAQVQSKLKNRNEELAKLQRDARSLEKLVEELRRAIEEFPDLAEQPFQRVKGKLPWPVKGLLLARFGQLRAGGPLKWQGLVIGAARGTQVRAPYHGRVVYADWLPGLGLLLVLDHGGGYMSLYGNNEQLYRRVGDRVSPGDVLSAVGDAAGVGKSGLYLEIRKGRQALDPAGWLTKH
jgi:septal ring factor EnvC (AmiA/AmiB activator)